MLNRAFSWCSHRHPKTHAYVCIYKHPYIHSYIHTGIHAYIQTDICIHSYIQTHHYSYIHTNTFRIYLEKKKRKQNSQCLMHDDNTKMTQLVESSCVANTLFSSIIDPRLIKYGVFCLVMTVMLHTIKRHLDQSPPSPPP